MLLSKCPHSIISWISMAQVQARHAITTEALSIVWGRDINPGASSTLLLSLLAAVPPPEVSHLAGGSHSVMTSLSR